ncbi:MAG: hypothetical protein JWP59_89 [Massilia sp.]|nr:hypothetical protein [Massilia sp.]
MNQALTSAIYLFAAVVVAIVAHKFRLMRLGLAEAQLEAARLQRHVQRLEMVLKQAKPEIFAHVKARSDMEWQQASKRLAAGEMPTFFPLEASFAPISSLKGGE